MEAWGGWAMLALFAGILVWEEAWDLPNTAALSAALLGLITAGAVATSLFYEKRMWCRCAGAGPQLWKRKPRFASTLHTHLYLKAVTRSTPPCPFTGTSAPSAP